MLGMVIQFPSVKKRFINIQLLKTEEKEKDENKERMFSS